MKNFLSLFCVIALVFVIALGCAVSLKSLKPGMDITTIFQVVDTMPVGADGFKVLSIPDKDFAKNKIEFIIFRHPTVGNYGYGIVGDEGNKVLAYDMAKGAWFFCENGLCLPISEEDAKALEKAFLKMIYEDGDFARARPFKGKATEVKGLGV